MDEAREARLRDDAAMMAKFVEYGETGDRRLRNELIEHYTRLAEFLARRFVNRGEPLDDLRQVALVGLLKAVEARLVQTENVRATLAAVDAGNADAAIVYATDARGAASAKVAFEVPASEQPRIVYVALRARDSKHAELAHRFLEFVAGSEGAKLLQDAGFTAPAP